MEKPLIIIAAVLMVIGSLMVSFGHSQNSLGAGGMNDQATMGRQLICGSDEMYTGEVVWVDRTFRE